MPFPGLTRLDPKQILTDVIWNELMDLLEAKFSGAVGAGDIQWPFIVEGDIDFGQQYGIIGLRTFWNLINAAEYPDLASAVAAAPAGGTIVIPPNTMIPANNVSINASNVAIVGFGPSSVVQITAASTNPLFTTSSAGISGVTFYNLTLDGTGAGAGCIGIQARRVTRFRMHEVRMLGFTGDFIVLTNDGVAGNSCIDARLTNVYCSGGSDSHLFADDVDGLRIDYFDSKTASGDAVALVPASSAHIIRDVVITGSKVAGGGAKAFRIVGSGAAGIAAHSRILLSGCAVTGCTGRPYELGETALLLKDAHIVGCTAADAAGDAIRMASNRGTISGCHVPDAGDDGIDIQNSVDVTVSGNNCMSPTAYGVNAASTTSCTVSGNNCRGGTPNGVNHTSSTSLRAMENEGDVGPTLGTVFANFTAETIAGTATGPFAFTHTIQANSFKTGDVAELIAIIETGAGSTGSLQIKIGATVLKTLAFVASQTYFMRCLVRANTAGNCDTAFVFVTEGAATNQDIDYGSPAVTWTTDQAVTFNVSAHGGSGNITLARAAVFYHGSK